MILQTHIIQKVIDKHSGDVPNDLVYAIFSKASPTFKELGVEILGAPSFDPEELKSLLRTPPAEADPNAELDIDPEDLEAAGVSEEDIETMDRDAQQLASQIGNGPIKKNTLEA